MLAETCLFALVPLLCCTAWIAVHPVFPRSCFLAVITAFTLHLLTGRSVTGSSSPDLGCLPGRGCEPA